MRDRSYDGAMAEVFRNDPAYARELLDEILADGAMDEAMIVLRQMSKAFGGVDEVAKAVNLSSTTLDRSVSAGANPQLSTLAAVLRTMGLRLAVQPLQPAA